MRLEFTDKSKTALALAQKTSKTMHASYVGTEHILLGLIREGSGVAARVLKDNKVAQRGVMFQVFRKGQTFLKAVDLKKVE